MQSPDTSSREAAGSPRLPALDLIRGVAILGILPVNISVFSGSLTWRWDQSSWWEYTLASLVTVLFELKMVSLLALLFGAGLMIQAQRSAAVAGFAASYCRRMLVLFFLGLANAVLLFHFDILTSYAGVGLVALFFAGRGSKVMMGVACANFLITFAGLAAVFALISVFGGGMEAQQGSSQAEGLVGLLQFFTSHEYQTQTLQQGGFGQISLYRALHIPVLGLVFLIAGWYFVGCALTGMWLVRRRFFERREGSRRLWWKVAIIGIFVALPFHLMAATSLWRDGDSGIYLLCVAGGMLPLALGYLGLLTLWSDSGRWPWLQTRLRAVGQMALTNYLLQSLLCSLLFYGYGFGLHGSVNMQASWVVVLAIWALEMVGSLYWLRIFKMGPAEWLWRSLSGTGARSLQSSAARGAAMEQA